MGNATSVQSETPIHPADVPAPHGKPLAMLTLLAVAVAMARDADGTLVMPAWASLVLQLPALVGWCAWRCGFGRDHAGAGRSIGNTLLTGAVLVGGIVAAVVTDRLDALGTTITVFIAGCLLVDCLARLYHRLDAAIESSQLRVRTFLVPWILMIVVVTALLTSPLATQPGVPDYRHNFLLHVAENAITAVSAACLVGTSAHSFGEDYALFGQIIIILTIHLAGLCFAAAGLAVMRPFMYNRIRLRTVLIVAYVLQGLGVAAMWMSWRPVDASTALEHLWWGVVHAGGAAWNAGFTLRPDGLMPYMADRAVFAAVATLSIIGSLGLPIILDLVYGYRGAKSSDARPLLKGRRVPPWCKLPQWEAGGAFVLLLFGAVLLFVLETPWRPEVPWSLPESWVPERPVDFGQNRICIRDDLDYGQRWTLSVFMSATLRSTGMQSMPLAEGAISWPSWGLMLAGMFVGGSAGGVAGGVRTSALLILGLCWLTKRDAWSTVPKGETARRSLMRSAKRFILAWLAVNVVFVGLFSLVIDATSYQRVLEAAAACNSVGLSAGLLPHLTWSGRLAMIVMMLIGRLVPVAFWLHVTRVFVGHLQSPADNKVEPT